MAVMEIRLADVVRLRKVHPCGGYEWEVVRLGADIGIVCRTCGRRVPLPSIPMGFVVGVVLDRTRKDQVLVIAAALRAVACLLFFFFHGNELIIYTISIGLATVGLFFNPAVISLMPSVVSRERLVSANSLYNFTLTSSQLAGMVFLAPILLKSVGPDGMFLTATTMFLIASWLASTLHIAQEAREELPRGAI